jgi:hypothetical protein
LQQHAIIHFIKPVISLFFYYFTFTRKKKKEYRVKEENE